MCGLAGFFLKSRRLEGELGGLLGGMLTTLTGRGPDSTGFAIYDAAAPGMVRLTVRGVTPADAAALGAALAAEAGGAAPEIAARGDHAVITLPPEQVAMARAAVRRLVPGATIAAIGERMELYKGLGSPADVSARFNLAERCGTHAIGHTRMATESAVTAAGAHPFSTGPDQCLVHNGSLSNHNELRRRLARDGVVFETENDSEVAAGYLSWRMGRGARPAEALDAALSDLDGFYTFVVGTRHGFGVLRDPIGCKPAVMAENDDYVAFASEYRALSRLPEIKHATVFEPEAGRVYFWERAA